MKKQERSGAVSHKFGKAMLPGDINDPESYKVRKGVTGGFREYLTKKEIEWCDGVIDESGYLADLENSLSRYGMKRAI